MESTQIVYLSEDTSEFLALTNIALLDQSCILQMVNGGADSRTFCLGNARLLIHGECGYRHPLPTGFQFVLFTLRLVAIMQHQAINGSDDFTFLIVWNVGPG